MLCLSICLFVYCSFCHQVESFFSKNMFVLYFHIFCNNIFRREMSASKSLGDGLICPCCASLSGRYRRSVSRGTLLPASATVSRHHLRSPASHQSVVPSYRTSSYGRRAFSVAGPMTWNSLYAETNLMRDPGYTISVSNDYWRHFSVQNRPTGVSSSLGAFLALMRGINSRFTYLLTLWEFSGHVYTE